MGAFDDLPNEAPAARHGAFDDLPDEHAADKQFSLDNSVRSIARGVPFMDQIAAGGDAATHGLLGRGSGAPSFSERYKANMAAEEAKNHAYDEAHPVASFAGGLAGGVGATAPLAATRLGGAMLGMGGRTLGTQMAASAGSGAALGAADAATRPDASMAGQGALGAATGAAGPVAGRFAGILANRFRGNTAAARAPTQEALDQAAEGSYNTARNLGVELHPQGIQDMATRVGNTLHGEGYRPTANSAPGAFAELHGLANPPPGATVNVGDFENARRAAGHTARNFNNPTDQGASTRLIHELDDYLANVPQQHVISGDPAALRHTLEDARGNYGAARRLERAEQVQDRADRGAGSTGSGNNANNKTRQGWNSVLNSEKRMRGYNEPELQQAEDIVRGTRFGNTMRGTANMLGAGGGLGRMVAMGAGGHLGENLARHAGASAVGGGIGEAVGGHEGAMIGAAVPFAGGYAARALADRSTRAGVRRLEDMIAMRSPLGRDVVQPARDEVARVNTAFQRAGAIGSRAAEPTIADQFRR